MYGFLLNMWVFGNVSEEQMISYVAKGFITREEADQIMATPKESAE